MIKFSKNNSLNNFPVDMLVISGVPLFAVILITEIVFNHAPIAVVLALLVACVGAGLVFWSKLPLYRAGIYVSFGPAAIPAPHRRFYCWGMSLAAGGCLVAALLLPLL